MTLTEIFAILEEALEMPISYLQNPKKRVYFWYLLSSGVLAYFVYLKSKRKTSFLQYLFNKEVWLGKSAFIDYALLFFNAFVKVLLIGPYLIFGLYLAYYTNEYMMLWFGFPEQSLGGTTTIVLYTITLTVIGDFFSFLVHYWMHKIPLLWQFHKVHHSASHLNPMTQYRIHPVELIINNLRGGFVFGLVTGLFDYWSAHQVSKLTFIGVNIFSFAFLAFGANLRHSHVKLKYPKWLEFVLISPVQHQIHHSSNPEHFDKNMGSKFAIWDWLFGTLVISKSIKRLSFGLGKDDKDFNTFWKNIYMPFVGVFNNLLRNKRS